MFKLNRQEKNTLLQIIQQNGFKPALFSWKNRRSEFNTVHTQYGENPDIAEALVVKQGDSEFYFTFEKNSFGEFAASLYPALDHGIRNQVSTDLWNSFLMYFVEWLSLVKSELEEPDLWNNPPSDSMFSLPEDYKEQGQFSEVERKQIKKALDDIQLHLKRSAKLSRPQTLKLEQTFIYLENKLETSSKVDWKNIFIGTAVAILAEPWFAPYAQSLRELILERIAPLFPHIVSLR